MTPVQNISLDKIFEYLIVYLELLKSLHAVAYYIMYTFLFHYCLGLILIILISIHSNPYSYSYTVPMYCVITCTGCMAVNKEVKTGLSSGVKSAWLE